LNHFGKEKERWQRNGMICHWHFSLLGYEDEDQKLPLGYLFSTLMFAVMCGSLAFQSLDRQASVPNARGLVSTLSKDRLLVLALSIASAAFCCMAYGVSSVSYHSNRDLNAWINRRSIETGS
jgi:hypothetical protein